jgi:hypothetical protein
MNVFLAHDEQEVYFEVSKIKKMGNATVHIQCDHRDLAGEGKASYVQLQNRVV